MKPLQGVMAALQFLTRIPLPFTVTWDAGTLRWALRAYSLVGAIIGTLLAVTILLLSPRIPIWMLALLIVSLWVLLTGGLHLDGWADTADAVGSRAPLDKQWEIMKDPHIGTFGTISVLFILLWKIAFTYAYLEGIHASFGGYNIHTVLPFVFIPAVARWGALGILAWLPAAKSSQLAIQWKKHLNLKEISYACIPIFIIIVLYVTVRGIGQPSISRADAFYAALQSFWLPLIFLSGWYGLYFLFYVRWVYKRFRAVNGDLVGAGIEGGELWLLAGIWLMMAF